MNQEQIKWRKIELKAQAIQELLRYKPEGYIDQINEWRREVHLLSKTVVRDEKFYLTNKA